MSDTAPLANDRGDQRALQRLIGDWFVVTIPALVLYGFTLLRPEALDDGDTGWHVAAGKWILAHRSVPASDIFSYSAHGKPWTAHEWLADVLMGGAHALAGWSGVLLLFALATAAFAGVMAMYLRRWLEPAAAAAVFIGVILALYPFLLARPHVLSWPVLAAWMVMLLRAREAERVPPWWSVLLITLWANLHGSFILGLALIGPFAAEALFSAAAERRAAVFGRWAAFSLAALLAALVTPYGIAGLLFPFQLNAMPTLALIDEWMPSSFASIRPFELVLLAGLGACLWLGVRLPLWRLVTVLGLLHMALAHARHQIVFVIIAALLLAPAIARAQGRDRPRFALRAATCGHWRELAPLLAVLAVLALGVTGWRLAMPAQRLDSATIPVTALDRLPRALEAKRVFNEYSFGGSLVLKGIPVFIDGRADMYGDAAMREYRDLTQAPDPRTWQATVDRWGIAWTILSPQMPLARFLDRQPGWRRIYSDRFAVIHVNAAGWQAMQADR